MEKTGSNDKRRRSAKRKKGELSKGEPHAKPSAAERERADLRAAIRKNPLRALYFIAQEYTGRIGTKLAGSYLTGGSTSVAHAGTLGPGPARILHALARVLGAAGKKPDIEALDRDENPHLWARKYLKKTPDGVEVAMSRNGQRIPSKINSYSPLMDRIDAAREFVEEVQRLRDASAEHLAESAVLWLNMNRAKAIGFGPPATRDLDELERRVATQIEKARERSHATAERIARAILRGWGMTAKDVDKAYKKT